MKKKYYLTSPIFYVNDRPHIGHAYTSIACDVMARFQRIDGYDVRFVTGTDEHGQKIEQAAQKARKTPKEFVDQISRRFFELSNALNISRDDFIRTTENRHYKTVLRFWRRLVERNQIYLGHYKGWYAVRDEAFYAESELYKDEKNTLRAPSGAEVQWVEEESYFFRLSQWQSALLEHYEAQPDFILPSFRRNEVLRFVEAGLSDLSISRLGLGWGIAVPDNPKHTIYVWVDALASYIAAAHWDERNENFWPAHLHIVGKDILRFHAVYWPALLMAAEIPLPKRVFAHGWWTNEGQKISKSLGNTIDPVELVRLFGVDQTRFFLMRELQFGQDGDYSAKALARRVNSELVNDLGNLCHRVLHFVSTKMQARIPEPVNPFLAEDQKLLDQARAAPDILRSLFQNQQFREALTVLHALVAETNRYIAHQAPWVLQKTDPERMQTVIYTALELIRNLAIFYSPFIPDSSGQILKQLGIEHRKRTLKDLETPIVPGAKIGAIAPLFQRIET